MDTKIDTLNSYFTGETVNGVKLKFYEFAGLSTATKPVKANMAMGCLFHEVDTATYYAYDRYTQTWYKQIELGGGD